LAARIPKPNGKQEACSDKFKILAL